MEHIQINNLKPSNKKLEKKTEKERDDYKKKDITKNIILELIEIVKEKKLRIEDILEMDLYLGGDFNSNKEALEDIKNIEMIKERKDGVCFFYPANKGWVSKDEDTEYIRYFSSNDEEYFYLDVLDIFIIFNKGNYGDTLTKFMSRLNITTKEEITKEEIRNRYVEQIIEIKKFERYKKDYPVLYKTIKSSLVVLQELCVIGLANIISGEGLINNKHCFFASTSYISSFIGKNAGTVSRHINLLTLLGFTNKPSLSAIPKNLLSNSLSIANNKSSRNKVINYYTINTINKELLDKAEQIAIILKENKLRMNNITHVTVKKVFGPYMVNRIYGNNLQKTINNYSGIISSLENKEELEDLPF